MTNYDILEVLELFDNFETDMQKSVDAYKYQLQQVRAGRANPHILDKVRVNAYGSEVPLNQVGNVNVPEARMIVITVWDSSLLKSVEKAILDSGIGITPNNDGRVIRLVFPELTMERRQQLVKEIKQGAEATKVQLRNARRDANDCTKKLKKDNVITEDDVKNIEKDVDKLLADYIAKVDALFKEKETEITSV
ncbi:MAG: ribosome recycling factor [Clostridia bacterium]|nr:ribosome recycling factor [Clostridia bacterium]